MRSDHFINHHLPLDLVQRRFLRAVDVPWDRATRREARDFSCWIQQTVKPRKVKAQGPRAVGEAGAANPVTGKPSTGSGYAPATVVHSETVLRRFYDVHRDAGTGPLLNPFPLDLALASRSRPMSSRKSDLWATATSQAAVLRSRHPPSKRTPSSAGVISYAA